MQAFTYIYIFIYLSKTIYNDLFFEGHINSKNRVVVHACTYQQQVYITGWIIRIHTLEVLVRRSDTIESYTQIPSAGQCTKAHQKLTQKVNYVCAALSDRGRGLNFACIYDKTVMTPFF